MAKKRILFLISFLIVTAYAAPNQSKYESPSPGQTFGGPRPSDISSGNNGVEATRTLVTMTILRWVMNIFKAMVQPARNMYLSFTPEISAFRCLSESREVQSMFGFNPGSSDDHFEGYFYETPRSSSKEADSSNNHVLKRIPRFIDEVASLLKDGGTMSCVVPYMRERVVRWLDG